MASSRPLSRVQLQQAIQDIIERGNESDVDDDDDDLNTSDTESDSEGDHESIASEDSDTQSSSDDETETTRSTTVFTAKNGQQWNSTFEETGKTRAHNIMKTRLNKVVLPPGVILETPEDAFNLFITDQIVNDIVAFTNNEARRVTKDNNLKPWNDTDVVEMRAFFGLLLAAGHLKSNHQSYEVLWGSMYGPPIFRATMGRNRFKSLLRYIRFDDKLTRTARRSKDKLAPIRDIWEQIVNNLRKHYIPGANITVDEQLVPFRGRCPFKQYLPSKPDKYGMKIWWACDSGTFYPLNAIPYTGKDVVRATGLGRQVVEKLVEPYEGSNRNVTCDNYFTDHELALSLLSKGLTIVGTVRKNKTFIPPEFHPRADRPSQSSVFGFSKTTTLVSYVPKPRKAVVLLSTMHHDSSVDEANANKPEIIMYYNSTKGAVDTLDQEVHQYMSKRRTNRWPFAFFMNGLDVTGFAAFVIWTSTYPQWKKTTHSRRRIFLTDISEELVHPQVVRRSANGLQKSTLRTVALLSAARVPDEPTPKRQKKSRCYLCSGDRKQRQCCHSCEKNVCNEHSTLHRLCNNCKGQ